MSSGSGARLGLGAVSAEHIGDRLGRAKHELGFYLELGCSNVVQAGVTYTCG